MATRRDYAEKRDFIRMAVDCPVHYAAVGDSTTHHGTARDLSGGGLLLESDQAWPAGTMLRIKLASEDGRVPPLEAETEVVRVTPAGEGCYELGLSIRRLL